MFLFIYFIIHIIVCVDTVLEWTGGEGQIGRKKWRNRRRKRTEKREKRMGVWGITRGEACKIVPMLAGPNPR